MMRSSALSFRRTPRGFTVIEILVVLALVAMLFGLVVTNVGDAFDKGREDVARIFVRDSLKTPLVRYRIDLGDYPSTGEGLGVLLAAPNGAAEKWRGPYMDVAGGKMPVDPWGQAYQYRYPGVKNPGGYDLYSKGPDKTAETADDIGNW